MCSSLLPSFRSCRWLELTSLRRKHSSLGLRGEAQKDRTHKAFYLTGDEETFKRGIAMVEQDIKRLEAEASNLEHQIELSSKYRLDISKLKEACALVASNIGTLSFEEKRLALQALQISAMIDGDEVILYGAVPIKDLLSVSTQSKLKV